MIQRFYQKLLMILIGTTCFSAIPFASDKEDHWRKEELYSRCNILTYERLKREKLLADRSSQATELSPVPYAYSFEKPKALKDTKAPVKPSLDPNKEPHL